LPDESTTPEAAGVPEAFVPVRPPREARNLAGLLTVASKELTQAANRRAFHLEKFAFVLACAIVFAAAAFEATSGWTTDLRRISEFGRSAFLPVSLAACAVLTASSLFSATGIVMSELAGKRLDLLRITPLSLGSIVFGKACAASGRRLLIAVGLLPILASTQLLGGVSAGDVVKSISIILTDIVFVTCLGVYVSAGSKSNTDRVFRTILAVITWLIACAILAAAAKAALPALAAKIGGNISWLDEFLADLTGVGLAGAGLKAPLASVLSALNAAAGAAISPLAVWSLHVDAKLTWLGLASNMFVHLGAACALLFMAAGRLGRTVLAYEAPVFRPEGRELLAAEDPNVEQLVSLLARSKKFGRRVRAVTSKRKWVGTLVGRQLLHTSLAAVMLPLAVGLPQVFVFVLSALTGGGPSDWRSVYPAFIATSLGGAMLVMLLIQSCSLLAGEKVRRTAELLALTPAGNASMIWWKGAAVAVGQALAAVLWLLMVLVGSFLGREGTWILVCNVLGFLAMLLLVYAIGISFSLSSRSPFGAFGLAVFSVLLLAPMLYAGALGFMAYLEDAGHGAWRYGRISDMEPLRGIGMFPALYLFLLGSVLVIARNVFPQVSRVLLAVGVAVFFVAGALAIPYPDSGFGPLLLPMIPLMNVIKDPDPRLMSAALWSILFELVLSAALLGGCYVNFTRTFLFGAKFKD
jgi:hypothetical protein